MKKKTKDLEITLQSQRQRSISSKVFTHSNDDSPIEKISDQAFQTHLQNFNNRLNEYNLRLFPVQADGNCLLRAIADQIDGNEDFHYKYRSIAVNEINKYSNFYRLFLPSKLTIKQYLHMMRQDGVWAGHLELQALCNALNVDIAVHGLNGSVLIEKEQKLGLCGKLKNLFICVIPQLQKKKVTDLVQLKSNEERFVINIAYHRGNKIVEHYSSIRSNENQIGPALALSSENRRSNMAISSARLRDLLSPQVSFEDEQDQQPLQMDDLKRRKSLRQEFSEQFKSIAQSQD